MFCAVARCHATQFILVLVLIFIVNMIWSAEAEKKQEKEQVQVIADFKHVLGELSWTVVSLVTLWWNMTEQEDFDSQTWSISEGNKHPKTDYTC